jgi:DNA-binding LacI/PurR family transcriptional regulator
MPITIKEIADKARVSIATVSRALNDDEKVKPETRQVILSIAREFHYKPNILARSLVKNQSNIIGVVLPEVDGEFFSEIIHGIDEIAYTGGYHTIVASSHSQRSIVESLIDFMGESLVRGIILIAPNISNQIRSIVQQSSIPILLINSNHDLDHLDSVGIDNYRGSYTMTEFLIKKCGYKKIAHIKGPVQNDDAIQRKLGYIHAMNDNNMSIKDEWIINGDFTVASGEHACRRLLSLDDMPEAVFAGNDMMALGCYKAAKSYGLKIPDDIGVAGFDDIFLADFLTPRLTTVHIPISEIGKASAELLLNRILNGDLSEPKSIKISTGLVVGDSCRKPIGIE